MRKNINECGVVLFNKEFDKFLIIFQKESLKWGLPKGHVDKNEFCQNAYFDCAKRELLEETGIMINNHKHRKLGSFVIRDKMFYVMQLMKDISLRQPIDTKEIGGIRWLAVTNLIDFLTNYSCNVTLKELNNYITTIYRSQNKIASV